MKRLLTLAAFSTLSAILIMLAVYDNIVACTTMRILEFKIAHCFCIDMIALALCFSLWIVFAEINFKDEK